ncbi:glycan-binding surface protein [Fodinibius salsisoli]|uniref:Surface glycan-binding protein B xyloglucan binding domain-containing protein n=1 Tax=Fodinibius salsisoli TaxID=2820877 RepID=A0ABT3PL79_9BACT|nr:glycan-binding surface protein [Fodinibius salsisoli]MCW9706513.1 hypothetical protein [Fodinibius salsisoli]
MKNSIYTGGIAALVLITLLVMQGCQDNTVSNSGDYDDPVTITGIRYASPDSTTDIEQVGPGDVVALEGKNMDNVAHVFFNGYETTFNPTLATQSHLVVTIPTDMPFGEMDPEASYMNQIKVTNSVSEDSLEFPVLPAPPQINRISDEFAEAGKEITLTGEYLYLVTDVIFPGEVSATDYQSSPDGSALTVTVPDGATSGEIQVRSTSGASTSSPGAHFRSTTGMICDFDDVFSYQWWSATLSSDASLYPGNEGQYAMLEVTNLAGGDGSWWNGGRSVNLDPTQWVEPSSLGESPSNFAVKFEINVQGSWEQGTLLIRAANPWTYTARYEPWKGENGNINAFTTNGWQTVQIPLSEFKTANAEGMNGAGTALPSLADMLPDGEASSAGIMLVNNGENPISQLSMAVDNIRVVRIAD